MKIDQTTYRVTQKGPTGTIALVIGLAALLISFLGYTQNRSQFFFSYLVAFEFWLAVGLGALFFVMLHHAVRANWSIVLRRVAESAMATLPMMLLLFVPVILGLHELYHWSHADAVAHDQLLQEKAPYLDVTFFLVRAVLYLAVWAGLSWWLYRLSIRQDKQHSEQLMKRLRYVSGPGIVIFGVTSTLAAFDWLMSLDPHWYSTIFGVYVFSGSFISGLAFVTLAALYLRRRNILSTDITIEHYHDLTKLIFAFIIFWAYMAFSQYMLIWYANIPEETVFFKDRWVGSWKTVSLIIVFGHFTLPFFALLTRAAKRSLVLLGTIAVWMLLMRWVDIYWMVMPNLHHEGAHLSWLDLTTVIGVGGLFVWLFLRRLASQAIVPIRDPGLVASKQLVNM